MGFTPTKRAKFIEIFCNSFGNFQIEGRKPYTVEKLASGVGATLVVISGITAVVSAAAAPATLGASLVVTVPAAIAAGAGLAALGPAGFKLAMMRRRKGKEKTGIQAAEGLKEKFEPLGREFWQSIVHDIARELARIYEYQIEQLSFDDIAVMAKSAVERIINYFKELDRSGNTEDLDFDRKTLVHAILKGKCVEQKLESSPPQKKKWNTNSVFSKPGLRHIGIYSTENGDCIFYTKKDTYAERYGYRDSATWRADENSPEAEYSIEDTSTNSHKDYVPTFVMVSESVILEYVRQHKTKRSSTTHNKSLNAYLSELCGLEVTALFRGSLSFDLSGSDFSGCDFSDADLSNADLRGVKFVDTYLAHAKLEGADLSEADCSKADFRQANLAGATLTATNFSNARLDFACLNAAKVSMKTRLSGATLIGIQSEEVDLKKVEDGAKIITLIEEQASQQERLRILQEKVQQIASNAAVKPKNVIIGAEGMDEIAAENGAEELNAELISVDNPTDKDYAQMQEAMKKDAEIIGAKGTPGHRKLVLKDGVKVNASLFRIKHTDSPSNPKNTGYSGLFNTPTPADKKAIAAIETVLNECYPEGSSSEDLEYKADILARLVSYRGRKLHENERSELLSLAQNIRDESRSSSTAPAQQEEDDAAPRPTTGAHS